MITLIASIAWLKLELFPLAAITAAVVIAAVFLLYPPQVRMLSRTWRILLPLLRSLAILALAAAVLKPIISRPKTAAEQGAIAIVIDRSRSMSVVDSSRTPAQLVALADGLGLLPAGTRSPAIAALSADVQRLYSLADEISRARNEVEYARLSGRDPQAAQKRLEQAAQDFAAAATSAAKQVATINPRSPLVSIFNDLAKPPNRSSPDWPRQLRNAVDGASAQANILQSNADQKLYLTNESVSRICAALAARSRIELIEQALTANGTGLLANLDKSIPVRAYVIADSAAPIAINTGAALGIDADGLSSQLTGGLQSVLDQLKGEPLQAVILLSDGRQWDQTKTVSTGLLPSGVPVFTIAAAPPTVSDLAITDIVAPSSVLLGETVEVRVKVSASGLPPTTAPATAVLGDSGPTSRPVQTTQPIAFSIKADKGGVLPLRITLPAQPGEASTENNQATRWVKVVSQRVRVAMASGSPGWDFRYFRNALLRTPWVELSESMLDTDAARFPLTPQQILQQDLLILNDVPAAALSPEQWDAVSRLVSERGGSVLLIAGEHLPDEYTASPTLANLLPYQTLGAKATWRTWPGMTPAFHLAPAPESADLDWLKLDEDPRISLRRWDELPPFFRYLALPQLKPNARMLLVERDSLGKGDRHPSREPDVEGTQQVPVPVSPGGGPQPILLESRTGRGRILFFGMNETWRWRYKVGEKDQDRFWLQLLRYAVEEPYALSAGRLSLDADKIALQPGEAIKVRARVRADASSAALPAQLSLRTMRDGKPQRADILPAVGGPEGGRYQATLPGLPAGSYELRLSDPADPKAELILPIQIAASAEDEMRNLSGDREHLRDIAQASGGKDLSIEQVALIPKLLESARQRQQGTVELPLWDSWYLYAFVVACLAAEWAMRKRFGLA